AQPVSYELLQSARGFDGFGRRRDGFGGEAHGMGKLRVRVDPQIPVDARDQVDWIHRTIFDLLALRIRRADHLAALEASARNQRREDVAPVASTTVPRRFPGDLRGAP